jgi:hypothetical protein
MTDIMNIYPLGYYDEFIRSHFIWNEPGIDLKSIGKNNFTRAFSADLNSKELHYRPGIKKELNEITNFIHNCYSAPDDRPIWYKINVTDHVLNEYVGIGFLNRDPEWLDFIIDYLRIDKAEQGGDTIFIIFDIDFRWAICFTLSQDEKILTVEKFEK